MQISTDNELNTLKMYALTNKEKNQLFFLKFSEIRKF